MIKKLKSNDLNQVFFKKKAAVHRSFIKFTVNKVFLKFIVKHLKLLYKLLSQKTHQHSFKITILFIYCSLKKQHQHLLKNDYIKIAPSKKTLLLKLIFF